jgi:hypothetical protein
MKESFPTITKCNASKIAIPNMLAAEEKRVPFQWIVITAAYYCSMIDR